MNTEIKNYLWGVLGLIWSNYALSEKSIDFEEADIVSQVELVSSEIFGASEALEEREPQSWIVRNGEHQDLLFIKSDNLMDHLVSSGSTPFTQSETFNMLALPLNRDVKLKEGLDKQKKEWLDSLIEEYLHRFSNDK